MSREQSATDKKEFRSFTLHLKQIYPSWKSKDITNFLIQSENLPSGAPRTITTTPEYIQAVKNNLRIIKNVSIRNVSTKLQQQGFKTSKSSIWRTKQSLKLKWWKIEI
ncbi:unnamed protein product, partial [Rotaria sordida]